MYAEPHSGSPGGDLKAEALKQQERGQIKLLVGGAAWSQLSSPTTQPRACKAGKPCALKRRYPHFTVKRMGPSNGQGLTLDENPELSS